MLKKTELAGIAHCMSARIKARFPNVDETVLARPGIDRCRLEAHLAEAHNLTLTEAREEFADFLFVEELSQEVFGD